MARQAQTNRCYKILVIAVLICLKWNPCLGLEMKIFPEQPTKIVDSVIDISCAVDVNNTKEVLLLQISKCKESPIAMVRPNLEPTYNSMLSKRIQVRGAVDNEANDSYLNLTLLNPRQEDGGEYKCTVFYLDDGGIMMEKSVTKSLVFQKPSDVEELMERVKLLEEKITKQALKESTDVAKLIDRVTSLEEARKKDIIKESSLKTKLISLEKDNKNMLTEITQLREGHVSMNTKIMELAKKESLVQAKLVSIEKDNKNILSEISDLKKINKDMSTKIIGLTKKESSLQAKIVSLENGAKSMAAEIDRLKNNDKDMSTKIIILSKKDSFLQEKATSFEKKNKNILAEIALLKNGNNDISTKITGLMNKASTTPAFSAKLSKKIKLTKGMTIVFDKVVLSQGATGYDKKTGIFTAPQTGLYFFYFFATIRDLGAEIVLYVNDDHNSASLYAHDPKGYWDHSNINSILQLQAGDEVKAAVWYTYGDCILNNYTFTMFGGYLIH